MSKEPLTDARCEEILEEHRQLISRQADLVQEEKVAALGQMTAALIHEMNSPLAAIHNALDISVRATRKIIDRIIGDPELGAERAKTCTLLDTLEANNRVAKEAAERIGRTVERLEKFSGLDGAPVQPVDLNEHIENTLELLASATPSGVRVNRNLDELPRVPGRPGQLNLVFWNLMTNALQAMDDGGELTVSTRVDGDRAVVEIADTGRGIDAERLRRIFDPTFTTRNDHVRLSTGLPISYNIIRGHAGSLSVRSDVGVGSTVTVELPLSPPGSPGG